jgi:hypothetical protein
LVVQGVRGCHCIEPLFGQEIAEPGVAETAGGFLDAFSGFVGTGDGFGCGIDAMRVEGKVELFGERANEFEIGVGFGTAEAVVEMRDVENKAQFPALLVESAEERD